MEAMGIEQLVGAVWNLDEYIVQVRVPVKVHRGYSDVDVVGVKGNDVRIAECKVRGGATSVLGYSEDQGDFVEWLA